MSVEEFIKLVVSEAKGLRKHTTQTEKDLLNETTFSPTNCDSCIYGQLTGFYRNARAKELADLAGVRITFPELTFKPFDVLIQFGKQQPKGEVGTFSPIELYIHSFTNDGKRILRYIKGETKLLRLMGN